MSKNLTIITKVAPLGHPSASYLEPDGTEKHSDETQQALMSFKSTYINERCNLTTQHCLQSYQDEFPDEWRWMLWKFYSSCVIDLGQISHLVTCNKNRVRWWCFLCCLWVWIVQVGSHFVTLYHDGLVLALSAVTSELGWPSLTISMLLWCQYSDIS